VRYSITFQEVTAMAVRTGTCPHCKKKVRRQRTFSQTVNPFNTIEDVNAPGGKRPKTYGEVYEAVHGEAKLWEPDQGVFLHDKCTGESLKGVGE
jgi:hypothetical protein